MLCPHRHLALIEMLQEELPKQQYMTYTFITGSSVGEELGKSINNVRDAKGLGSSLLLHVLVTPCMRMCMRPTRSLPCRT
jgi:hypothetical protein